MRIRKADSVFHVENAAVQMVRNLGRGIATRGLFVSVMSCSMMESKPLLLPVFYANNTHMT